MSDKASEIMEKLGFTAEEKKKVITIVKAIYSGLLFRKLSYLMPLEKEERQAKRIEFLQKDIDDHRLLMIYCYNQFVKNPENDSIFTVPIEDVLEKDEFYNKLIKMESSLSDGDRIEWLQQKTNKSYKVTEKIYDDMMLKIKKACGVVLKKVGELEPVKMTIMMHFVFNAVHIAETESITLMDKDKVTIVEKEPCDANKYLGIDLSFLGIFDDLPKECAIKNDKTILKMRIVEPVRAIVGGKRKTRRRKNYK